MIELFPLLTINLLAIIGFYRITEYGYDVDKQPCDKEFLWFIRYYSKKWFGWFAKPICTCHVCMSSLHSVYIFWPHNDFTWYNLYLYAVYMLALAGLMAIYERVSA